jgi:predicted lipoprotein with Yx(FWY)xxD motif
VTGRLPAALAVFAAVALGAAAAAAAPAAQQPPSSPAEISVFKENGAYVFRTNDGMAIYTFARDADGHSNCVDRCAEAWPPVAAPADARPVADWRAIDRPGGRQWAYKGRPVYTFAKDTAAATTGDGLGGVWALAKP